MTKSIVKEVFQTDGISQEKELSQVNDKYVVTIENEVVDESLLFEDALCLFCSIY